jgi:hypothetical protein
MVRIEVRTLVPGADTVDEGRRVASALQAALANTDVVFVSFSAMGSASSSFVSAAIIPALREMGFEQFKRRIRIVDASWQIADVVKRRIALELASV